MTTLPAQRPIPERSMTTFREGLRGEVLLPEDGGFEEATRIWNGMIEKTPALVVRPTGTADVVEAVNFVREHDLPLSGRATSKRESVSSCRTRRTKQPCRTPLGFAPIGSVTNGPDSRLVRTGRPAIDPPTRRECRGPTERGW